MGSEVRDFLDLEKRPTSVMDQDELAAEVEGWRVVFSLLPRETLEWMARLHDVVRFTKRNYQGNAGVLLGFKLECVEYTIGLTEVAFDSLHGKRIVEDKVLVIPAAAVMFMEFIGDVRDFDVAMDDERLAVESLG